MLTTLANECDRLSGLFQSSQQKSMVFRFQQVKESRDGLILRLQSGTLKSLAGTRKNVVEV